MGLQCLGEVKGSSIFDYANPVTLYLWGDGNRKPSMGQMEERTNWEGEKDEDGNPILRKSQIWHVQVSGDPASLELAMAWLEGFRPVKDSSQVWTFLSYYNSFIASIVVAQHFPRNEFGQVELPSSEATREASMFVGGMWEQEWFDAIYPEKARKGVTIIPEDVDSGPPADIQP